MGSGSESCITKKIKVFGGHQIRLVHEQWTWLTIDPNKRTTNKIVSKQLCIIVSVCMFQGTGTLFGSPFKASTQILAYHSTVIFCNFSIFTSSRTQSLKYGCSLSYYWPCNRGFLIPALLDLSFINTNHYN